MKANFIVAGARNVKKKKKIEVAPADNLTSPAIERGFLLGALLGLSYRYNRAIARAVVARVSLAKRGNKMVYFHALVNINGVYNDTITGKAQSELYLNLSIWAELAKKGDIFDYSIIEIIKADSRDGLNEKISEGV